MIIIHDLTCFLYYPQPWFISAQTLKKRNINGNTCVVFGASWIYLVTAWHQHEQTTYFSAEVKCGRSLLTCLWLKDVRARVFVLSCRSKPALDRQENTHVFKCACGYFLLVCHRLFCTCVPKGRIREISSGFLTLAPWSTSQRPTAMYSTSARGCARTRKTRSRCHKCGKENTAFGAHGQTSW